MLVLFFSEAQRETERQEVKTWRRLSDDATGCLEKYISGRHEKHKHTNRFIKEKKKQNWLLTQGNSRLVFSPLVPASASTLFTDSFGTNSLQTWTDTKNLDMFFWSEIVAERLEWNSVEKYNEAI